MVNTRLCLWTALVTAIVATATMPNAAQGKSSRPAKPPEVAPRGLREARDIAYGDWQKLCFKAGGTPLLCRTSITGKFPTGQMAVRVDLIAREDSKAERLQVFVPVGMYLQDPVKLTIDQGRPHRVPYSWCVTNACIAADVAEPGLIKEMESGKRLVLEVVDSSLLSLTTSLPLSEFAAVHKGKPAKTMDQDIDE